MVSGGCQKIYVASNLSSQICGKRKRKKNPSRAIEYIDPSSGKEVAELQTDVGWKGRQGNHHYILDLPLDSSLGLCYWL